MPRVMMRMTAKLTGIRTVINAVISGSRQPWVSVHGTGVEVERGDDESTLVVVANLQSVKEVVAQGGGDVRGGDVIVAFGCISSAAKEGTHYKFQRFE